MYFDSLEPRRLLTITTSTFDAATGQLSLVGNDKRDIVEITPRAGGGVEASYDGKDVAFTGKVKSISIKTNGAGDTISVATLVGIPCYIDAGDGGDYVNGSAANDTLIGGGGLDILLGGRGNDSIDGGLQGDLLAGSQGNDTIIAGSASDNEDTVSGGKGDDTVDYSKSASGVKAHTGALDDTSVSDILYGDIEKLIGSPQADNLKNGTKRGMRIDGGAGNDTLSGGSGNDTIIGGTGNNRIEANGGADLIDISAGGQDRVDGCSGIDTVTGASDNDTLLNVP